MADVILEKFARTLVRYSLALQPGDLFLVRSTTLATPLLREVCREALEAGANVITRLTFDGAEEVFHLHATDAQLDWISPTDALEVEQVTARLVISAPYNTRSGQGLSPERAALRARAVQRLNATAGRRSATGEMRWCSTLFPTHALAQEADMSLPEYEEFVYRAMFLDQPDPIAAWQAFSMDQQKKADLLEQVETLRFVAEGTDLTVRVGGRKWMNSDGKRNFPSGEVFTGPIEDSANGTIRFTFPSLRGGREVDEARLSFRNGRVVEATAARGEDAMLRELDTDEGARYLGEVAIGNNYGIQRYTKNTLFDEKIGGTCHFALGKSYAETGGTNVSAIHWDLVCDLRQGGEVIADGKTIHRDGQWVV